MADKQALNATFFAFRKREKGGVLTMTSIAFVVICVVACALFVALNLGAITDVMNWYANIITTAASNPDAAPTPEMFTPPASVITLWLLMFPFQVLIYVIVAAYEAACLKWMIRGETGGLFGFSFGADTWRVYLTYWIWFVLQNVVAFALFFIVFGSAIGSMVAIGASGGDAPDLGTLGTMGAVIPILLLVLCIVWLWVAVRLAPAAATSVARQRFAFFEAWNVTKGRFWALFGAFLLLNVMATVAFCMLYFALAMAIAFGVMGQVGAMSDAPTPEQVGALLTQPSVLIPSVLVVLVGAIGSFVYVVATFGVGARAAALALDEGRITVG